MAEPPKLPALTIKLDAASIVPAEKLPSEPPKEIVASPLADISVNEIEALAALAPDSVKSPRASKLFEEKLPAEPKVICCLGSRHSCNIHWTQYFAQHQ